MKRRRNERGQALIEAVLVTPLILLIMVGIFELTRAFQAWQVVSNAAREGARAAVVANTDVATVEALVRRYMTDGALAAAGDAVVSIDPARQIVVNGTAVAASQVAINYPFQFVMLQPVARLVVAGTRTGEPITIRSTSLMRNEAQ